MSEALIIGLHKLRHSADKYQFVVGFAMGLGIGFWIGLEP